MRINDIIRKYLLPGLGLIIATESRYTQYRDKHTNMADNAKKHQELLDIYELMKKNGEKKIEDNKVMDSLIENTNRSLVGFAYNTNISSTETKLEALNNLISERENKGEDISKLLKTKEEINNNILHLNKESKQVTENLQGIMEDINKRSDISEYLFKLIDEYRNFVNTLEVDQLVALINVFGYYMILVTIVNITLLLFGDYLIQKFNLETRFPKLSNLIKLKKKLRKGYLFTNVFILYLLVILLLIGNILMVFF